MGLDATVPDETGRIGLTINPYQFLPSGTGNPRLSLDESAIVTAVNSLRTNDGPLAPFDLARFGGREGTNVDNSNAYAAAYAAAKAAGGGNIVLRQMTSGIYGFGSTVRVVDSNISIECQGKITLQCNGAGVGVDFDGTAAGAIFNSSLLGNPLVRGNANCTNAVRTRLAVHGIYHFSASRCTNAGLLLETGVLNEYRTRVTVNENGGFGGVTPLYGVYIDATVTGTQNSTANTFYNPILEGVSTAGMYAKWCDNTTVIGGSFEGMAAGAGIVTYGDPAGGGCGRMSLDGTFFEGNGLDFVCDGFMCEFRNILGQGTSVYGARSYNNRLYGGQIGSLIVTLGSVGNSVSGSYAGTITDNSGVQADGTPNLDQLRMWYVPTPNYNRTTGSFSPLLLPQLPVAWNIANIANNAASAYTVVAFPGARVGDRVGVSLVTGTPLLPGYTLLGVVAANDFVSLYADNNSGGAVNEGATTVIIELRR